MATLFSLGSTGTISLEAVTAIYYRTIWNPEPVIAWYVLVSGVELQIPATIDGLVDELFAAWRKLNSDPRAGLRPCTVQDCGPFLFHQWTTDSDGKACAIIEDVETGKVQVDFAWHIQFTDTEQ